MENDFSIWFTVVVSDGKTEQEIACRHFSDEVIHMICEETARILKVDEV